MGAEENTRLIRRIYDAFARADVPAILDALADDVEWWFPGPATIPFGGRRRGREQVAQFFAALSECVEVDQFEVREELVAGDDRVIVLGRERVRVKSTGSAWDAEWAHVWTIRDGKVAQVQEFSDTAAIVDAFLLTEPMV